MLVHRTQVGKHRAGLIARLFGQLREVDAPPVQARRRAGFQPADPQRQFPQPRGQRVGGRIAGPTAFIVGHPDVHPPGEEGAGGQHHRAGGKPDAALGHHPGHPVALNLQIVGGLLEHLQVRLILD